MSDVFVIPSEFDCRSCGSTHSPDSGHRGLCEGCWHDLNRWAERTKIKDRSETTIARWMARRLMLDATRLTRYGIVGRCEAVSVAERGWLDGLDAQCRNRATGMRDGRRVCSMHVRATRPLFVGSEAHNPYEDIKRVLTELAKSDPKFRDCLSHALTSAERTGK